MKLLSVDIGTTSCKAGLFELTGAALRFASRPTPAHIAADGSAYYEPDELFQTVCRAIRDIITIEPPHDISLVSVTSMAETGGLVDRATGTPRSHFIPWFDMQAAPDAEFLARQDSPVERFYRSGIHPNAKVSLAKMLWLHRHDPSLFDGSVWLSAADYVVFRFTGQMVTDYSLAGRTFGFRIDQKRWDADWIRHLGLPPDIFPPARPSGEWAGSIHNEGHHASGLPVGTPAAVAGHDHICGALGAGAVLTETIFDSMGTAEVMLGTLKPRPLTQADFDSGLSFGCHVVPDQYYWLGGLSASGVSIEWMRSILGSDQLTYQQLDDLLEDDKPTDILYFPYLLGTSSSSLNRTLLASRAAFVGLEAHHRQVDLLKAVLQGTAYEMERLRRAAEQLTASTIEHVLAAGGGTRNKRWIQIKADVSNCVFEVSPLAEVTLLGAAMIGAIQGGLFTDVDEAIRAMVPSGTETFLPDADRHHHHERLYTQGYLPLQQPLIQYYATMHRNNTTRSGTH